jgi:hypothetical protein
MKYIFRKVESEWLPWLREAELDTKETSADEDLRNQIFVYMPSPVAGHSGAAINIPRDTCELILDVCKDFRGRTTSRTEDETICLGLLLQTEMKNLLAIKPIP